MDTERDLLPADSGYYCPYCKSDRTVIRYDLDYCQECERHFDPEAEKAKKILECPDCGSEKAKVIEGDVIYCPDCDEMTGHVEEVAAQ